MSSIKNKNISKKPKVAATPKIDVFPDVPAAAWDAAAEIADAVQSVISEAVDIQKGKTVFDEQDGVITDLLDGKKISLGAKPYMDAPKTPPRRVDAAIKTPWAPKKTGPQIRSMLCRSVGSGAECPHGDRCTFAHNDDELGTEVPKRPFIPKEDPRYKTALCFNAECPHADCTFAHSEDELRKRQCKYGERCFSVVNRDGRWENKNESGPKCLSYHPDETYENFRSRQSIAKSGISVGAKKPIFRETVSAAKFADLMKTIDPTKYSEVFITIS